MSKATKNERISTLERQVTALITLVKMKGYNESEPQLKQLDQSIFDGLDEKWRFAAVDRGGLLKAFTYEPKLSVTRTGFILLIGSTMDVGTGYDASNWQNSLIERDITKELTGSDLARAMLARGDNYIMCVVGTIKEVVIIDTFQDGYFYSKGVRYLNPKPINNQGEPLTASEAGL